MYIDIAGCKMVEAIDDAVLECRMVDIAKDAKHVE
jgi:hypothetical protein